MHKDVKLGVAEREHKPAGVWPEELQRSDGEKGGISGGIQKQMELKLRCRERNL